MNVTFVTYPTAFATPGGGERQFIETFQALERLNVSVAKFDTYNPLYLKADFFHIFTVYASIDLFVNWAIDNSMPYALSPILWPTNYDDSEMNRIRHIIEHASVVLVNSYSEAEYITRFFDIKNVGQFRKVVNAINPKPFISVNRNIQYTPESVLTICNIDERKNLRRLASACRKLGRVLTIAGAVRDSSVLYDLKTDYGDIVNYVGPVGHGSQEHLNLLGTHGVYAMPSLYETPGLAALEAGAAGMPLVVTEVGGTKEYYNEHAHYCNPLSEESIVGALEAAFNDPPFTSEAARAHFSSFSWDRAALETYESYKLIPLGPKGQGDSL